MDATGAAELREGVAFLAQAPTGKGLFLPETLSEEDRMLADTARQFMEQRVLPRLAELETDKLKLSRQLMREAGELGILGADIPEAHGGLALGLRGSMLISEQVSRDASFACTYGAHTGIGSLPIVFFGTAEQQARFLPGIARGEILAAFALTEPNAGSDALSLTTRAARSADGRHYILTGEKQWITNAGFADIFIVSAKLEGGGPKDFATFIVEAKSPGLSTGREEEKMGIHGSSTRSLILERVQVPAENLLSEVGQGHKVALNTLNIGRLKLGFGCTTGARMLLAETVKFATARKQFDTRIADFGMTRRKLSRMAIRGFATESMSYVVAGWIEDRIHEVRSQADADGEKILEAIEEYAVECAITKVLATEALDRVVDDALQIHGGYGYMREYPIERVYRDARINRIFEGTNEINRLVVAGTIFKRAMKGRLDLMGRAAACEESVKSGELGAAKAQGPIAAELDRLERYKRALVYVAMRVGQKFMANLKDEQEFLELMADGVIAVFAIHTAAERVLHLLGEGSGTDPAPYLDLLRGVLDEYGAAFEHSLQTLLAFGYQGEKLEAQIERLRTFLRPLPIDRVSLDRRIAEGVVAAGGYPLR